MPTLTIGREAEALAEYGDWTQVQPLSENPRFGFTQTRGDEETVFALTDANCRIIMAADEKSLMVLGALAGIMNRDKMDLTPLDIADAACEVMCLIQGVAYLFSPLAVVGWDMAHGGIKIDGIW